MRTLRTGTDMWIIGILIAAVCSTSGCAGIIAGLVANTGLIDNERQQNGKTDSRRRRSQVHNQVSPQGHGNQAPGAERRHHRADTDQNSQTESSQEENERVTGGRANPPPGWRALFMRKRKPRAFARGSRPRLMPFSADYGGCSVSPFSDEG